VLDAEATPTSPTCRRHVAQDEAIADMQVMLQEMERHYGKRPIIYTTVDFYEANLSNGALMDYPIWVRSTKYHPAVKYGSRAWHFWQYQSDGRVPGIGGNVDKDAFYGTKEQWDAFLREPGVRPAQTGAAGPAPAPTASQTAAAQPQESIAEPASSPANRLWISIRASSASDHMRLRLQYLGEMVEAAERTGDAELLLQAHHSSWSTRIWNGEFARATEHVRSGLALYDPERHRHHALMYGGHDPGVCGNGQGAVALWALGCPDQAGQSAREGIVLGQASDHLPSLLHSLWFAASVYFLRRQAADVLECSARLLALGGEHGLKLYEAIGGVFHGWARIQQRNAQAGLAELRAAVAAYATIAHVNLDLYRAILAEAELRAGNLEEAAAALIQGERTADEWWRAGYLRLRGDLLLRGPGDDRAAAERLYREAINVAAGQQAKSLELRAATSLALLLRDEGKRDEARNLLAPVYGWFTEGFDTLDLKEAKALLDVLAS
jgi:Glycosyl hydrolases family 25